MKVSCSAQGSQADNESRSITPGMKSLQRIVGCGAIGLFIFATPAISQVVTVDTSGRVTAAGQAATVDRRYQQVQPTNIALPSQELDTKARLDLIRFLQADQGFAMRPFPRGHKGLTLEANGKLDPAGEAYLSMVTSAGVSAKPGDRLVITDIKFEHSKIIFMLNGGPDAKHRFLQHVQIGSGTSMGPVVPTDGQDPAGARLTLTFQNHIPEVTGKQVEALLAPLISFEVKTPIQAYTDTLPPKLKEAILDHDVLVGMSTDMVLFAKGQPQNKIREMDGQMPFEEWVYGKPPQDVEFVRINGNRVIRVEVAKIGKPPVVFTKDEVEGMMRTDGTPLEAANTNVHTVKMGDVQRDPDTQAAAPSPSLRGPGEAAPDSNTPGGDRVGVMKPVQFPKQAPDDHPVAHKGDQQGGSPQPTDSQSSSPQPTGQTSQSSAAPSTNVQAQPVDASKSTPANPQEKPQDKPDDEGAPPQ